MRAALRRARRGMQMIFQDPYASLNPRWRVADIVAEPIRALAARHAARELDGARRGAARAGRPRRGRRRQVSAPVLRRAAAADLDRARAVDQSRVPGLRRADVGARRVGAGAGAEPDARPAARASGLTYLFISHNLAVVHHIADRVGVMYLGRIVELAPTRELFAKPQHPYTRMLLDAVPDLEMTGKSRTAVAGEVPNPLDPPSGCTFHPRCPHANERCRREKPGAAARGRRPAWRGRVPRRRGRAPAAAGDPAACRLTGPGRRSRRFRYNRGG